MLMGADAAAVVLLGAIVLVAMVLVFVLVGMYNRLVRQRIAVDNAFSQIDVQLKRRHDLIPNLVETVRGYAAHERGTLEAVMAARSRAVDLRGASVLERAAAENALTQALARLLAVVEAYPDLKANTGFLALQEELAATENRIGFARQHYNDTVARYEESRQAFPTNLVAAAFNFGPRDYFRLDDAAQREVPKVQFT